LGKEKHGFIARGKYEKKYFESKYEEGQKILIEIFKLTFRTSDK
jgi:hypothetical protein